MQNLLRRKKCDKTAYTRQKKCIKRTQLRQKKCCTICIIDLFTVYLHRFYDKHIKKKEYEANCISKISRMET